ncbi:MAG: MerR family transcriptional regulator [Caldilineaceae bacterium]|nr:MerR family transcriptional regulator [Caldilineaceae bacterium]
MIVDPYLRTRDLAQAVQVSVQLVRNYEESGFIPVPERSPTGYRLYTQQHLVALKTARELISGYGWQRAQRIMQAVHDHRLSEALALIDERHAELDRTRHQLDQTLAALNELAAQLSAETHPRLSQRLRVGEAADSVGVRISALRFWEEQGLLHPVRERGSNYRLYDEKQMRRLRVVALLRQANHDFTTIRATLAELEAGQPQRALAAVEGRRSELARQSWHCLRAMAAFYAYVSEFWGGFKG